MNDKVLEIYLDSDDMEELNNGKELRVNTDAGETIIIFPPIIK